MYGLRFFLIWTGLISIFFTTVAFTIFSFLYNTWWFVGTLLALLISVWSRLHTQRINIRAALNLFSNGKRPKTLEEFQSCCKEAGITVVGSGWASYLNRKAYRNCIYTSQLCDRVSNKPFTWQTGATIRQVMTELQKENKTLSRFPTQEWVTLGGWISTWSHSHPGTDKLSPPVTEAKIFNTTTNRVGTFKSSNFVRLFEQKSRTNIVLTMTVNPIDDFAVERIARHLETEADARWWLSSESVGRLIFAGKRGALALLWKRTSHKPVHMYNQGVFGQWWAIDINSYLNCDSSLRKVARNLNTDAGRYQTFSRSLQIVPDLMGEYVLFPILLGIYNFEVYVKLQKTSFATFLQKIVGFHNVHGGRSEIRFYGDLNILAIDWAIHHTKVRQVFSFLQRNGYNSVALHWGKKIVDVHPCSQLKLSDLM